MEWVPQNMWFTYLHLNTPAGNLDYDLAVSTDANAVPALADTGVIAPPRRGRSKCATRDGRGGRSALAAIAGIMTFGIAGRFGRRRRRAR